MSDDLIKAIAVLAELTNKNLSIDAARVLAKQLGRYPHRQVIAALNRCMTELKFFPTVSEVIDRLEDGHPGVEEAWAMIPKSEDGSVVWTDQMAEAFGVARQLLVDDEIGARMAFKECYLKLLAKARLEGKPPKWTPSFGYEKSGREAAVRETLDKHRIDYGHALQMLPDIESQQSTGRPAIEVTKLLQQMPKDGG